MNTMKKTTGVVNLINLQTDPRPPRQPIFGDHVLSRHVAIVYDVDLDRAKSKINRITEEKELKELRLLAWKRDKSQVLKYIDERLQKLF